MKINLRKHNLVHHAARKGGPMGMLLATAAQHAGILQQRESARRAAVRTEAAEAARRQWLDALLADECRAWMSIGEADRGVLSGMCTVLALAGMAHTYDAGTIETPELRIIRGAISAADQCGRAGSVITADTAGAFKAACFHAKAIVTVCSTNAIIRACEHMQQTVQAMPADTTIGELVRPVSDASFVHALPALGVGGVVASGC